MSKTWVACAMRRAVQPSEVPRGAVRSGPECALQLAARGRYTRERPWADHPHPNRATPVVFPCVESHRRLDAVLLHIKARARQLAVVKLRSNYEYRGAGYQKAAVARGVSEDRGGRVNRVFGFSALVADLIVPCGAWLIVPTVRSAGRQRARSAARSTRLPLVQLLSDIAISNTNRARRVSRRPHFE